MTDSICFQRGEDAQVRLADKQRTLVQLLLWCTTTASDLHSEDESVPVCCPAGPPDCPQ